MSAPLQFAAWLTAHEHVDPRYGWVYRYHSRSDAHSIALCNLVLSDLLAACPVLKKQALADRIVYGINARHVFPNGKKRRWTWRLAQRRPSNNQNASPV